MIRKETNRSQKKVFGSHCLLVFFVCFFFFPEVCKPVCRYRFNEYSLLLQVLKVLMRRPPLSTCLPLHLGFACFLLHVTVFPARKSWVQLPSIWFLSWQQPLCPQKDFGVEVFFSPPLSDIWHPGKSCFLPVLPVLMQTWALCTEGDNRSEGKADDYVASLTHYQVHGLW